MLRVKKKVQKLSRGGTFEKIHIGHLFTPKECMLVTLNYILVPKLNILKVLRQ